MPSSQRRAPEKEKKALQDTSSNKHNLGNLKTLAAVVAGKEEQMRSITKPVTMAFAIVGLLILLANCANTGQYVSNTNYVRRNPQLLSIETGQPVPKYCFSLTGSFLYSLQPPNILTTRDFMVYGSTDTINNLSMFYEPRMLFNLDLGYQFTHFLMGGFAFYYSGGKISGLPASHESNLDSGNTEGSVYLRICINTSPISFVWKPEMLSGEAHGVTYSQIDTTTKVLHTSYPFGSIANTFAVRYQAFARVGIFGALNYFKRPYSITHRGLEMDYYGSLYSGVEVTVSKYLSVSTYLTKPLLNESRKDESPMQVGLKISTVSAPVWEAQK